jgi:hypothetical protein
MTGQNSDHGKKVLRGGAWNNKARNVRAAYRNANDPDNRNNNIGFRCARAHAWVGRPTSEQELIQVIAVAIPKRKGTGCVSSLGGENSPRCRALAAGRRKWRIHG